MPTSAAVMLFPAVCGGFRMSTGNFAGGGYRLSAMDSFGSKSQQRHAQHQEGGENRFQRTHALKVC